MSALKTIINIGLALISTVMGVLIAELFVALIFPQPAINATAPDIFFVRYDETLGWVNKEGAEGLYKPGRDMPGFMVNLNRNGMRGRIFPHDKEAGAKRILILGDSNTFGYGIREEERFSELLAEKLPEHYEVLNLGVFAYGTDQEFLLFEREGLRYKPDVVVVGFSAGDLSDNMNSVNAGYAKPFFTLDDGELTLRNTPVPRSSPLMKTSSRRSRIKAFLYRHSHLYRLALMRLLSLNRYMFDSVAEMSEEEGMRTTVALLARMNNVCRENGCRLAVLLIPHEVWIEGMSREPGRTIGYYPILSTILSRLGIPVIDPTRSFIEHHQRGEKLFLVNDPVHLNFDGNRLTSDILYQGLMHYRIIEPEVSQ